MKRMLVGIGLAGLLLAGGARAAGAQDLWVRLSWGPLRGQVHVADGFRVVARGRTVRREVRTPYRLERRHFAECVADGPYLYCWDAPGRRYTRPVVYVYVTDRAEVARLGARGHVRDRRWERRHQRAAERAWRRWADAHGYRYDRARLGVQVAFTW